MADPFVAEIRIFPFNFPPTGWSMCNGQLMAIVQNTALFSLLGTTYGGDGKVTYALPDFQGRLPMSFGHGPGLTDRQLGEQDGAENVTLLTTEMPGHSHTARCNTADGDDYGPAGNVWAPDAGGNNEYAASSNATMNPGQLVPAGGSLPHSNMQPYLALNFCIAMYGIFPPRS
jgi:microcystin-dependent protein